MNKILILTVFLTGCVCLNPDHKKTPPPIANTGEVIESLEKTKTELEKAGESNTLVGTQVEKALSLAERLEQLLEQIEQNDSNDTKEVVK